MSLAALVIAQDVATAVCGLFNAGYFVDVAGRATRWGRRMGGGALASVSAAAAGEAVFSQTLYWARDGLIDPPSTGAWALLRLPLLAATLFISIIVLRRILST